MKKDKNKDISNVSKRLDKIISNLHLKFQLITPILCNVKFNIFEDDESTLYTDGKVIGINKKFVEEIDDKQFLFSVLHEIFHVIFCHQLKDVPIEKRSLMEYAMEYVVNYETRLYMEKIFNISMPFPTHCVLCKHDSAICKEYIIFCDKCFNGKMTTSDMYKKLFENFKNVTGVRYCLFKDFKIPPEFTDEGKETQKEINKILSSVVYLYNSNKELYGNETSDLIELISDIVFGKINWKRELESILRRANIISGMEEISSHKYNFKHPLFVKSKVLINDTMKKKPKNVIVAVDVSGSVSNDEYSEFVGEVKNLLDNAVANITYIECDCEIKKVEDKITSGSILNVAKYRYGGGGTDFIPVFNYIKNNIKNPSILIYLTDGYGEFPDVSPSYPVIWVLNSSAEVPFGRSLFIR